MSLEPLRITGGTKFAAGLASIVTWSVTLPSGFATSAMIFLPFGPADPLSQKLLFGTLALVVAIISVAVSFLLVRAALGRFRTGGSLSRFFRYQLAALGAGGGLGLGFLPAMIGAAPVWWVISIGAGVGLIAVSLLAFRGDPRRPLTAPTHPGIGLTEGVVVDYWSGAMPRATAPGLIVVRFADEFGRARVARHLIRRNPTTFGTMGQVQYDRCRPEKVLRFVNGRPPFAEYPPHPRLGEHF